MGEELGPFSSADLAAMVRKGQLSPNDFVKKGRDGKWVNASEVNGLFVVTPQPPSVIPPLEPSQPLDLAANSSHPVPQSQSSTPISTKVRPAMTAAFNLRSRKVLAIWSSVCVIAIVLVAFALILRPRPEVRFARFVKALRPELVACFQDAKLSPSHIVQFDYDVRKSDSLVVPTVAMVSFATAEPKQAEPNLFFEATYEFRENAWHFKAITVTPKSMDLDPASFTTPLERSLYQSLLQIRKRTLHIGQMDTDELAPAGILLRRCDNY